MSGHIGKVELCSSCNNPVHVELCPGQLPALISCGDTYGATLQQSAFNPLGGAGFTWVVEKSGVATTILYTLPSNASADQVEQLVNRAKAGNGTDFVGTLRWSLGGALTPFPNTEWPSHGISYERASATTVRITWTPTNFAEDWSNTLVSLSSQQAWLTNTTSFTEEGLVNAWPLANLTASVWQKSLTSSVQTLPVSVPCGVEITNADELALAIGAQLGGGGSSAAASPDTEIVERFVCASGVTLVQRTIFTGGVAAAPTYFGLNGAAVAAPATFTEGPCDDQDIDLEVEYVCAANVTLIRRRIVDGETGTLISETFNGTNGAAVAAPATYTMGNCSGFGTYPVLRCGATSNVTTTANVQATRVALENDVILTKSCPTTSALTNNVVSVAPNAAVTQAATAVPANARGVTVYNVTRARIAFTISSHGTITIPPNGTWSGNLPDNVPPYSGAWSIANQAGNAGPAVFGINPAVQIDWVTRV
jgi:hypothetical protein